MILIIKITLKNDLTINILTTIHFLFYFYILPLFKSLINESTM